MAADTVDQRLLIWMIVVGAALASTFFTVVPIVPGTIFVPIGAAIGGLVSGWDELPWWFWVVQAVLVVSYVLVDNLAQVLGVKRAGGSKQAMVGGAVGVFVGPLLLAAVLGPFALFLGPPVGAVVGTLLGEERARQRAGVEGSGERTHVRLGAAALVAFVIGTALKLAVVGVQVAFLALTLL